jgi:hypothetical protein
MVRALKKPKCMVVVFLEYWSSDLGNPDSGVFFPAFLVLNSEGQGTNF